MSRVRCSSTFHTKQEAFHNLTDEKKVLLHKDLWKIGAKIKQSVIKIVIRIGAYLKIWVRAHSLNMKYCENPHRLNLNLVSSENDLQSATGLATFTCSDSEWELFIDVF